MSENKNLEKDNWDKCKIVFDIAIKFVEVVFLGVVALVIKLGADNIAQSLERGRLVQSLADQLVQANAKRDIALIALNEAIPRVQKVKCTTTKECEENLKHDQVFRIAEIVANGIIKDTYKLSQSPNSPSPDGDELSIAEEIIVEKTSQNYYDEKFGNRWQDAQSKVKTRARSNADFTKELPLGEVEAKAKLSKKFNDLQPSLTQPVDLDLAGIRLVYIQYKSDRAKAEKLQKVLQDKGILAPGIEQVDGIKNNDIRYANAADKPIAEKLRVFLEKENIKIEPTLGTFIDLSTRGYKVPLGQFEVWLKD
jgi:hypothetical protein